MKDIVNGFFQGLKDGFNPSKAITNYRNGSVNLANLTGTSLVFIVDRGTMEIQTTSTSTTDLDALIFIQNMKSVTQQDDLLDYIKELHDFLRLNPRLGGVEMVDIKNYDITISEDGLNLGLLSVALTLTMQV
jgi:hypothetical protein